MHPTFQYLMYITAFFIIFYDMENKYWNALTSAVGCAYIYAITMRELSYWFLVLIKK